MWRIELRGGAYDGWEGETDDAPEPVLIAWKCRFLPFVTCEGHATFDPHHPGIVLRTAEAYRRVELDEVERLAVYEVGEGVPGPGVEEREVVQVGGGWRAPALAIAYRYGLKLTSGAQA